MMAKLPFVVEVAVLLQVVKVSVAVPVPMLELRKCHCQLGTDALLLRGLFVTGEIAEFRRWYFGWIMLIPIGMNF